MSVQFQIEEMTEYLAVRFTCAVATTKEDERQFESIVEVCKRSNIVRLLLDFTMVPEEFSLVDRYQLGVGAKIFAKHNFKVAAICRPELRDAQCFAELVAQNRWVNLRGFTDFQSAEEWLLK